MSRKRTDIVSLSLTPQARERLAALANQHNTSRSAVVQWLLLGDEATPVDAVRALKEKLDALDARVAALESQRKDGAR